MRYAAFFISIFIGISLLAQDSTLVKYSYTYKFRDGLYLNVKQIRSNNPIPLRRIITDLDVNSPDFYSYLLSYKKIYYLDINGTKREIPSDSLLAVAKKGKLYIHINDDLFPLNFLGNLIYFVATITVYDYNYSVYDSFNYYQMDSYKETRQYILDLYTGKIYDYTYKNLMLLLKKYDKELYEEYEKLSKRKRKKQLFVYIRKFNERHPLYLPKID